MDMITVGKTIKQFRKNQKISQEVLSGLASVGRSHLSQIELGKSSPTITVLSRLADALKVKVSDIVIAIEEAEKNNPV